MIVELLSVHWRLPASVALKGSSRANGLAATSHIQGQIILALLREVQFIVYLMSKVRILLWENDKASWVISHQPGSALTLLPGLSRLDPSCLLMTTGSSTGVTR